jgi:hypothetical protein
MAENTKGGEYRFRINAQDIASCYSRAFQDEGLAFPNEALKRPDGPVDRFTGWLRAYSVGPGPVPARNPDAKIPGEMIIHPLQPAHAEDISLRSVFLELWDMPDGSVVGLEHMTGDRLNISPSDDLQVLTFV